MKKLISLNFLNLFFLLLVVEICLKIFQSDYRYYERTFAAKFPEKAIHSLDTNWVVPEPDLGWVCQQKTKLKFYQPAYFGLEYAINQEGFRMESNLSEIKKGSKKRILLLGDSFLFGIFLENEKTIATQLQKKLGTDYEVVNLSVPGWGIDQMFQAYHKYRAQIQPDQVVLLFIDDDIQRTVEAFYWGATTKRAYKLENEKLTLREPTHGRLNLVESWFVFNFQIINRLYHFWHCLEAEKLSKVIFKKLILEEKNAGRELVTIRLPRKEQVAALGLQQYDLTNFFNTEQIEYYDFVKEIQDLSEATIDGFYIPNDDHLSEKGAREVAEYLLKILK